MERLTLPDTGTALVQEASICGGDTNLDDYPFCTGPETD
jgi:hypothetical protein